MTKKEDIKASNSYYCPMKCEGEKVYEQPGDCPVCNMHLVPVGEQVKKDHVIHDNHQHHHSEKSHKDSSGEYYCPMRCEGDKVYNEPGDCPVCGMHLKKEENTSTQTNTIKHLL